MMQEVSNSPEQLSFEMTENLPEFVDSLSMQATVKVSHQFNVESGMAWPRIFVLYVMAGALLKFSDFPLVPPSPY